MSDAVIRMGYSDTDLRSGLDKSSTHVKRFASQTKSLFSGVGASLRNAFSSGLGLLGVGGGIVGIKALIDDFDRLGDLSHQLGISAEGIQRIGNMAKLSGSDVEIVAKSLNRMNKELASGQGVDTFKKLGLSLRDYFSADGDQQIIMLAEAFQKAQKDGRGLAEVWDLFGKSASELIPLLKTNKDELREIAGIDVISQKQMDQIQKVNDEFDKMMSKGKAAVVKAPSIFSQNMGFIDAWMREHVSRESGAIDRFLSEQGRNEGDAGHQETLSDRKRKSDGQRKADAAEIATKEKEIEASLKKELDECEQMERSYEAQLRMEKEDAEIAARKAKLLKEQTDELAKQRDAKLESIKDFQTEMQILELRAKGKNKEADAVEKEARIKKEAHELAQKTGISEKQALETVRRKAELEDKIARRKSGDHKIHGYTNEQREQNTHIAEMHRRSFARPDYSNPFRGLDEHRRFNSLFPQNRQNSRTGNEQVNRNTETYLKQIVENTSKIPQ